MKHVLQFVIVMSVCFLQAQVGIGTTNPTAELEISTTSSGLPALELNPQTTPIGTAAGQLSVIGNELYLYDNTRSKWLSVASSTLTFGHEGNLNNTNLEYAGDIDNSGPNMPQAGTIVYATLNSSGGNPTKGITLTVYNELKVAVSTHPLQLHSGELLVPDFNVDFNEGDYFMVKVDDGGATVSDVSMVLWTKWTK